MQAGRSIARRRLLYVRTRHPRRLRMRTGHIETDGRRDGHTAAHLQRRVVVQAVVTRTIHELRVAILFWF